MLTAGGGGAVVVLHRGEQQRAVARHLLDDGRRGPGTEHHDAGVGRGLHGGDERGVIGRADGDFDDGFRRRRGGGRDESSAESEGGKQSAELHVN